MQIDPIQFFETLIVIFFAVGLHEYAHCALADAAGDPTPRYYGRMTLNLFKHFDPLGTVMIVLTAMTGYGIGWGKPAPMDPRKMRNPQWDFFMAVLAGPLSNFFQAVIYGLVLRFVAQASPESLFNFDGSPNALGLFLELGVILNLSLMFFNLIPLGPLDGHWLVGQLMKDPYRYNWNKWNATMGTYILFGLILIGQVSGHGLVRSIIAPGVDYLFSLFTGLR